MNCRLSLLLLLEPLAQINELPKSNSVVTKPNNYYLGCMAWKVSILMIFYPVLSRFCNKMENYRVIISVNRSENHIWYCIQYSTNVWLCEYDLILPGYHLNLAYFFHHTVNFIISTRNLMPWQTVALKPKSSDWGLYQGNQANPAVSSLQATTIQYLCYR